MCLTLRLRTRSPAHRTFSVFKGRFRNCSCQFPCWLCTDFHFISLFILIFVGPAMQICWLRHTSGIVPPFSHSYSIQIQNLKSRNMNMKFKWVPRFISPAWAMISFPCKLTVGAISLFIVFYFLRLHHGHRRTLHLRFF